MGAVRREFDDEREMAMVWTFGGPERLERVTVHSDPPPMPRPKGHFLRRMRELKEVRGSVHTYVPTYSVHTIQVRTYVLYVPTRRTACVTARTAPNSDASPLSIRIPNNPKLRHSTAD